MSEAGLWRGIRQCWAMGALAALGVGISDRPVNEGACEVARSDAEIGPF